MTTRKRTSVRARSNDTVRYRPHPGLRMEAKARAKLLETTGKDFDHWVRIATRSGISELTPLRTFLAQEHAVGSRNAWWIAEAALQGSKAGYDEPEALVDALYSGSRAALRPLHEALIDEFLTLGEDVLVTACKTMVPIYRKFVFAELRPVRGAIEARLVQGASRLGVRLERKTKSAGDRLDCAVRICHADEIDEELRSVFRNAYEAGTEKTPRARLEAPPPEFLAGLAQVKDAASTWSTCTPAMQRDILAWITEAKLASTRSKRLGLALERLAAGKRKIY